MQTEGASDAHVTDYLCKSYTNTAILDSSIEFSGTDSKQIATYKCSHKCHCYTSTGATSDSDPTSSLQLQHKVWAERSS